MIFHQPGDSRGNYNYNAYTYERIEYAPHFHKNMELIVVLKGSIPVTVDGVQYALQPGQMVLVLSHQIHSFQVPADAAAWVVVFSEEYVPHFAARLKGKRGSTSVFEPKPSITTLVMENLISGDCSVMMKKACFYAVCDEYLSAVTLETRSEKSGFVIGRILDWIAEHYTEDISLRQASEVFGYEYHYLSRLLNRGYRISFVELLHSYRVAHAIDLLESTQLPITEVMLQSGFQSIRSFNLVFRRVTGKVPSDYRLSD